LYDTFANIFVHSVLTNVFKNREMKFFRQGTGRAAFEKSLPRIVFSSLPEQYQRLVLAGTP
jgi:hypothetical protein